MLKIEAATKRLVPLVPPIKDRALDLAELIRNSPAVFFAELGLRVFPVGQGVPPHTGATIQADLLALDEAGRSVIVSVERRDRMALLESAITCAALVARWKADDFLGQLEGAGPQHLKQFLSVDVDKINHTQRIILVGCDSSPEMLVAVGWLSRSSQIDINCISAAMTEDSEKRQGYLTFQQVFPDVAPPTPAETVERLHGEIEALLAASGRLIQGPPTLSEPEQAPVPEEAASREPLADSGTEASQPHAAGPELPVPQAAEAQLIEQLPAERSSPAVPTTEDAGPAEAAHLKIPESETAVPQTTEAESIEPQTEDEVAATTPRALVSVFVGVPAVLLVIAVGLFFVTAPAPTEDLASPVTTPAGPAIETGGITGIVEDSASGKPITGATLYQAGNQVRTDESGRFQLETGSENAPILVKAVGYRPSRIGSAVVESRVRLEPLDVRAVYVGEGRSAKPETLGRARKLLRETPVNSVVIGVKSARGFLSLPVDHKMVREIGAHRNGRKTDLAADVSRWKREGVYTIALVGVFRDDLLARKRPKLAIRDRQTAKILSDSGGMAWTDPSQLDVREYNIATVKAAAAAGFDEILLDFIRYPALRGGDGPADYGQRLVHITQFLRQAKATLTPYNAVLSATVLGSVCTVQQPGMVGQKLEEFTYEVDYVCPMLYPSTYAPGKLYPKPLKDSYRLVTDNLKAAAARLNGQIEKLRPWLQNYPDPAAPRVPITADTIRSQVTAAADSKASGWMLWDSRSRYRNTLEALLSVPESKAPKLGFLRPARASRSGVD